MVQRQLSLLYQVVHLTLLKNRETISSYVNDLSSGASGDLSTVITALNTLSGDNYNNALEALDYNTSGAISSVVQSQVG